MRVAAAIVLMSLGLTGCLPYEDVLAMDSDACIAGGFVRGSTAYRECRLALERERALNGEALQRHIEAQRVANAITRAVQPTFIRPPLMARQH